LKGATIKRLAFLLLLGLLASSQTAVLASVRDAGKTPLDGRWQWTWTKAELNGAPGPHFPGSYFAEFRDGRHYSNYPKPGSMLTLKGTFTVHGVVVTLHFRPGATSVEPGRTYMMRFSIYRDRLTWSKIPGHAGLDLLPITPWTRVH